MSVTPGTRPMRVRPRGANPLRKVTAAGLAGAITTIIVFLLNSYVVPESKPLTPEIASAITTIITVLVAYLTPLDVDEVEVV